MTLLAIHHFTYYSGNINDYPSISFSVLISRQNTRATLNMFQHGKLLWRMPISLLPRNLRKVEPELRNTMTGSYAVLSYNLMTVSWYVTYQNEEALENYEHTGKTRYTILSDSPVYEVKPETGTGPTCVLHRNLLLPCDSLPLDSDLPKKVAIPKKESKQVPSRRQRQFKCQLPPCLRSRVMQDPVDKESSSDEDNFVAVSRPTRPPEKSPCSAPPGATSELEVTPTSTVFQVLSLLKQ